MNEEQEVKTAKKKAIKTAIFYVALIFLILWLLTPFEGINNLAVFVGVALFLGFCAVRDVRRITFKKPCALCGADIYPIVITAKNYGKEIKHCPFCGGIVEKI